MEALHYKHFVCSFQGEFLCRPEGWYDVLVSCLEGNGQWKGENFVYLLQCFPTCSSAQHSHHGRDAEGREEEVLKFFLCHLMEELGTEPLIAKDNFLYIVRTTCKNKVLSINKHEIT